RNEADKQIVERAPQRQDAVIRLQMAGHRAMPPSRIAVELDMREEEIAEALDDFAVGWRRFQHRAENALEPAILIAGDAERADLRLHPPHPLEIARTRRHEAIALVFGDWR